MGCSKLLLFWYVLVLCLLVSLSIQVANGWVAVDECFKHQAGHLTAGFLPRLGSAGLFKVG